jgi:hypothetical protein
MARIKKAQKGIRATADNTRVKKNMVKSSSQLSEAQEKLKIAKKLYKDNPSKVFSDAVDSAKVRLSRVPKQRNGGSTPAWQRKEGKNPEGGLNAKGVASYRRANPGSKLKTAVTTKPSKLKPGSKSANRRKSFCARMSGMKKRLTSAKTANDPNSRINKSLRKWNC